MQPFSNFFDHLLLSTHADRQGAGISFTVFVRVFVWLQISPAMIKLAASNFARWSVGVLGRECPILGNFAPPQAQNQTNRRVVASTADRRQSPHWRRMASIANGMAGHALGMCGYIAIPEDGRTFYYYYYYY